MRFIGIAQGFFEVIDYRYRFNTERFIVPITAPLFKTFRCDTVPRTS